MKFVAILIFDSKNPLYLKLSELSRSLQKNGKDPYYDGEVDYGDRAEHCWNGDHTQPNYISRLRYHQMFIPKIVERIEKSAPPGSDLTTWRY